MTLSESTPPFLPEYTPPFQQLYYYATLTEYIPPSLPPRIYPLSTTICHTRRNYPSLETIPLFLKPYAPLPLKIYPSSPFYNYIYAAFQESTPESLNMPPFLDTRPTCNCERIYHPLPELKNILGGGGGRFCKCRTILYLLKRGVYSGWEG